MKQSIILLILLITNATYAGETTDLLNGKFRIHSHKIRSISVKCDPSLAGKYRVISKLGYLYEFYTSAITCLDEQYERERFEQDYVKPYEYIPYPLVYNFDFQPVGIRYKYLLSKIQLYPRKPSSWHYAPKVPYKDENGDYIHKFVYEPLDETDFQGNCEYATGTEMTLKECIAYIDKQLEYYPSTAINKSVE